MNQVREKIRKLYSIPNLTGDTRKIFVSNIYFQYNIIIKYSRIHVSRNKGSVKQNDQLNKMIYFIPILHDKTVLKQM